MRTGVSGRVAVDGLKIVGSERTLRVSGWDTRTALGLKDTWFRFKVIPATTARTARLERAGHRRDAGQPRGPRPTPDVLRRRPRPRRRLHQDRHPLTLKNGR